MSFADIAKRIGQFATDNSTTILTSVGVAGTITTAFLAAKASWEASDIVRLQEADEYNSEQDRREPREVMKDRFRLTWRLYIPAATVGIGTIVCVVGANRIGSKKIAGMTAAAGILERGYDEYKEKVKEKLGERKEGAIHTEIAQKSVDENPPPAHFLENGLELTGLPDRNVCQELYTLHYFYTTVEDIRSAVNEFNNMMNHNGTGTLADFYAILDIPVPPFSNYLGWNTDRLLEVEIDTVLLHGKPILTLRFKNEPHQDYNRVFR